MYYLKINRFKTWSLFVSILLTVQLAAQPHFNLDVNKKGVEISPSHYGVSFEDINHAADGGLYAELINNRSFEFDQHFVGWTPFGDVTIQVESPYFDRNLHYVRLNEKGLRLGTGLVNETFRRIGFKQSIQNQRVQIIELHSNNLEAVNTLEKPNTVIPVQTFVNADSNGFTLKASGNAFYVCKLNIQKSGK